MGVPKPGNFTRDLFQLSCLLDKFSTLGRPVYLTAVGAPSRNNPDPGDAPTADSIPRKADAGTRGGTRSSRPSGWTPSTSSPSASRTSKAFAWGDLADLSQNLPGGGLLDDMLKPKPSYGKLQELREALPPVAREEGVRSSAHPTHASFDKRD
jgi:hypothetical protein